MISRRSAIVIGQAYEEVFSGREASGFDSFDNWSFKIHRDLLHEFLSERGYQAWFCQMAKSQFGRGAVQAWISRLHTGETQFQVTQIWPWEARINIGQRYLENLAEDLLSWCMQMDSTSYYRKSTISSINALIQSLRLDGYWYQEGRLLRPEVDAIEAGEAKRVLQDLYAELELNKQDSTIQQLESAEKDYVARRWHKSASTFKKYLESILKEVAIKHSSAVKKADIPAKVKNSPAKVRNYLEEEGLLEAKEYEELTGVLGLLKQKNSDAEMSKRNLARLLRHLTLTLSSFTMLRLKDSISNTYGENKAKKSAARS